jgi:hypothetical protein
LNKQDNLRQPTADDFSNRQIKKKVLLDALQHPTTLYSAAAAVLSGLYMGLVSFDETSFAVTLAAGLFSLISFVYHYFIRGEKAAREHVQELLERRRSFKEQQGEDIEKRCRSAGFQEGEKAAKELKEAYTRLDVFLKEQLEKKQTLTAQRFLILAEESYYQGIQFLNKALALFQAIGHIDENKLKQEMRAWQEELERAKQDEQKGKEYKELLTRTLTEKINSQTRRLQLYTERKETLEQVLSQSETLEATLDSTYLEAVDLAADGAYLQSNNAAANLERAVAAARKVENRLRGMDAGQPDEIYDSQES